MARWRLAAFLLSAACLALATPAAAQDEPRCRILCAPELKIEPTWTIENLGGRRRIEVDGEVESVGVDSAFELVLALDVPTTIPRVGFTFEAIFSPFGSASVHPFTGVAAADLGRDSIRDNGVEIETEFNFNLFRSAAGPSARAGIRPNRPAAGSRPTSTSSISSARARRRERAAPTRTSSTSSGTLPFTCSTGCHRGTGFGMSRLRCRSTTSRQVCPRQATSSATNGFWTTPTRGRSLYS